MQVLIQNRQARHKFTPLEEFVAGLVLTGPEVKMIRLKRGNLAGAHIRIINREAFLINAQIPPYPFARQEEYDPSQMRKLLLSKKELLLLDQAQTTKGLALIPFELFLSGNRIKLRLAICKAKLAKDRREEIKKRDLDRESRAR